MYRLYFTSQARKDAKKLAKSELRDACDMLLKVIQKNPFQDPPSYKKLKPFPELISTRRTSVEDRKRISGTCGPEITKFDDVIINSGTGITGDFYPFYARRINRQHRLVYDVDEKNKTIKILSMWSHYESLKS